jgi:hypothetical protein
MAKKKTGNKQVEQTLDILRDHLLDIIDHPEKLDQIPNNATVILIPVPMRPKKAA